MWSLVKPSKLRIQERCIQELTFPESLVDKVKQQHSYATDAAISEWKEGFKRYLELQLRKPKGVKSLAMPSEGIDSVWHAGLLHTRWYAEMCTKCLGYFLHHEPFTVSAHTKSSENKKRELASLCSTYYLDCLASGMEANGKSVPLMFAMDKKWKVAGGYHYGDTQEVSQGMADFDVAMFTGECMTFSAAHVALRK